MKFPDELCVFGRSESRLAFGLLVLLLLLILILLFGLILDPSDSRFYFVPDESVGPTVVFASMPVPA